MRRVEVDRGDVASLRRPVDRVVGVEIELLYIGGERIVA